MSRVFAVVLVILLCIAFGMTIPLQGSDEEVKEKPKGILFDNEYDAIQSLKKLHKSQEFFQNKVCKDTDVDDAGEFATDFDELSGDPDNSQGTLAAHVIGFKFFNITFNNEAPKLGENKGYYFQLYTPSAVGYTVDDDETSWCCLAWPKEYGKTGQYCFGITESGSFYKYQNPSGIFSGKKRAPKLKTFFGTLFDNKSIGAGDQPFAMFLGKGVRWKESAMRSNFKNNTLRIWANLRAIHNGQALFREKVAKDLDRDKQGEFAANFDELSGDPDNSQGTLSATSVGVTFINMIYDAENPSMSEKSGYWYRIFTSSADAGGMVDDDEKSWCCLVWPKVNGKTEYHCLGITEDGNIYWAKEIRKKFTGSTNGPSLDDFYGTHFDNKTIGSGTSLFTLLKSSDNLNDKPKPTIKKPKKPDQKEPKNK